jgi:hypothetical protein
VNVYLKIIFLALIVILTESVLYAQDREPQALDDSCVSAVQAISRSVVIPGIGQLYQERLGHAAFFYGASAIFYYNTFFYLYRYNKTGGKNYYNKYRSNLSAAIFIHILNIFDVTDAAVNGCPKGWQGELLSDKPVKSPWGAVLRSAIVPGWGQVYNESYLKAAGYLAVDGYLFYKIRENDIKYRDTDNKTFRNRRSKYSWYFGVAYLLTMADAYAGAYLFKFDKAMGLTVIPVVDDTYKGLQLSVYF